MKRSTTLRPTEGKLRLWAVLFWLLLWQVAAMIVGRDFLLASPLMVVTRLFQLGGSLQFWQAILRSMGRILLGFALGSFAGVCCGVLAARFVRFRELIEPLWLTLRAIPVASFVVVALIWLPSRRLSVLISFLIVFPMLYSETRAQIGRTDPKLTEMASLMHMAPVRRCVYLYALPALRDMENTCATAMGLAWKSGIAAELISIPDGTIGERLYQAKVYLMTGDLFAWTIVIVALSALCARLLTSLMRYTADAIEKL